MSAKQHREQAALLRANGSPKAVELAKQHDALAKLIDKRNADRPQ